jgi:transglutaminase-like putative cysteine protease
VARAGATATTERRPLGEVGGSYVDDLFNLVLLVGVVLPPAYAVAAVRLDPILPFDLVIWCAAVGLLLGLGFARSGGGGELLHPIAIFGIAVGVFYAIAETIPGVPDDATLGDRLAEIEGELANWISVIAGGGQATNNLLFLLLLCLVGGYVGYFSAWAVFREQSAWWAVTVSATALTLVLANFPSQAWLMIGQLLAAMVLVGRMNLRSSQLGWAARGIRQSAGIRGRAFWASAVLALALLLLTWVLPALFGTGTASERFGRASGPWQQAQDQFNRLFGGLQAQNDAAISGFSRSLTLHGSFHLADTPVLSISSPKAEYWRVIVFDQYNGHGWISTDPVDQRVLPAGANINRLADAQRADLTQEVTVLTPRGNYLSAASQASSFDRPVVAQAFPDAPGGTVDLVSAQAYGSIEKNTRYQVISKVSEASALDLRGATQTYPAEIRRRYLPLPSMPSRVRQLADQLTQSQSTPYDKANAVESYLRSLPYTLDPPAPPSNQDGVDFFLFDAKTGYCDYFASAMAVMLRDEGIPARVVSGYSTGTLQDDGNYLVKDSDSHTWTEVYLPPFGWIPFEPSGGWPRFDRGSGGAGQSEATPSAVPTPQTAPSSAQSAAEASPTPSPTPTPNPAENATVPETQTNQLDLSWLIPIVIVLALLALLALVAKYLWEKDLKGLPPAVVAYIKMSRLAAILGFGSRPGETPGEYGEAIAGAVPNASASASQIASEYARYRFGHKPPVLPDRSLFHWHLVRNALLQRLGRLRR